LGNTCPGFILALAGANARSFMTAQI
jgi:hypothetical protein